MPLAVRPARGESGSSESESSESDTGEPLGELCEAALDPATYADGPVPTPTLQSATPECPAYSGKLVIDLPSPVQVTGTVMVDGIPTPATVQMTGRNGEGTVAKATEARALRSGHGLAVTRSPRGPGIATWLGAWTCSRMWI